MTNLNLKTSNICTLHKLFGSEITQNLRAPSPALRAVASRLHSRLEAHLMPRLQRVGQRYANNPVQLAHTRETVKKLFIENLWEGAYAELCALDFFCYPKYPRTRSHLEPPLQNVFLPAKVGKNYGVEMRQKKINLDLHFEDLNVFTDVKILRCNVTDFVNRLYREVWPKRRPMISHDIALDRSVTALGDHREALLAELRDANLNRKSLATVRLLSPIGTVRFNLKWEPSVMVSEIEAIDPFRHARERCADVFKFANKFLIDSTFFLTIVHSDIFSPDLTDLGDDDNRVYYRAFSRRVFFQHQQSTQRFAEICPAFGGGQSVSEVLRNVAGILFIEDKIRTTASRKIFRKWSGADGYLYCNPNAGDPHPLSLIEDCISCCVQDDFRYDQY